MSGGGVWDRLDLNPRTGVPYSANASNVLDLLQVHWRYWTLDRTLGSIYEPVDGIDIHTLDAEYDAQR